MLEDSEKEIESFYKYNYSLRKLLYPYYLIREMQKYLNKMYGKVVQRLIDEEFNEFMEYEKGSHENKKDENLRNGNTSKSNGKITIMPPRDREGKFEP